MSYLYSDKPLRPPNYSDVLFALDAAFTLIRLAKEEDSATERDQETQTLVYYLMHAAETLLAGLMDKINAGIAEHGMPDHAPLFDSPGDRSP